MNIVIAGSGDTGTHLAKMLSEEHKDVVLMSTDAAYLDSIDSSYNLMTLYGDATCVADLRRAEIGSCDLFIAVTPYSDSNIVACQLASILGAGHTIARVGCCDYLMPGVEEGFRRAGVRQLVYPETLVADEIAEFIHHSWVLDRYEVQGGELIMAGVRIRGGSPVEGRRLMDLHPQGERTFHVAAVRRYGRMLIPRGDDALLAGDVAYFIMRPEHVADVAALCGAEADGMVRHVMILGAGAISRELARRLRGECSLTVIDPDKEACRAFAEEFDKATVVCAPMQDINVQREEGLRDTDLFVALSGDAPSNIVACMMARDVGARKTVAQIESIQYIMEAERLGVDKVVNKKLITSGHILRTILGLGARVESVMAFGDAEVADITVGENARVTRRAIKDLGLPRRITLGGMLRDGKGYLVEGRTEIRPGDRVLVFFSSGALGKVEHWFNS